jgi:ATP-dependent DNA helicase RecQ
VFTLRWDEASGAFDDRAMTEFLDREEQPREVLDVSDHFFVHEQRPTWALLVRYRDVPRPGDRRPEHDPRRDHRTDLDARGRATFDQLRAWRGQTARREGLPPYLICTNRQLAEVATRRPATLAELGEIPGLGESKVARFGAELLVLVAAVSGASAPEPAGD